MPEPRAVVIGYGFAGKSFHAYLTSITPGLTLHGVASRSAETRERIVADHGCKTYETFEQVIADPDVDLVILATPNSTHCELAVRAMEAGKHVVSDKVACLDLAECDRMIAASVENDVFLTIFHNRRFDGDYLTLRSLMDDGSIGDLRSLEMAWQGFGVWGKWRAEMAMGGGKLYDLGAHLIDQICMLIPCAITSVYCRNQYDLKTTDTESQSLVVIGFENGATAICDTSSLAAIQKPRFNAFGTGGTFLKYGVDPQEACMIKGDIDAAVEPEANYGTFSNGKEKRIVPTLPGRWRNYYENVRDVIAHGAEPAVKMHEVRRAIAVIDAALRSTRTGEVIHLNIPGL